MLKGFIEVTTVEGSCRGMIPLDQIVSISEIHSRVYMSLRGLPDATQIIETYDEIKVKIIEAQR